MVAVCNIQFGLGVTVNVAIGFGRTVVVQVLFGIGFIIGDPTPLLPSEPVHAILAPAGFGVRFIVGEEAVAKVGPEQTE
jgi:hypothetical protein